MDRMEERVQELAEMPVTEQLPRDLVLLKMENEQMMTSARVRPRDLVKVAEEIKAQLRAFPLLAQECLYNKPVGKDRDGTQKFAQGLSVRAAEMLAEAYGYNRVALSAEPLAPGAEEMRLTAVFVDYQKCRMWQASVMVTPWYKDHKGSMVKMPTDRFLDLKVKAELSKLGREAILRCVSTALKIEVEDFAHRCLLETLPDDFVARSVKAYVGKGVTLEQLEALVGKASPLWSKADGVTLTTIYKAIQDEETTVAQVFGGGPAAAAAGPVTAASFTPAAAPAQPVTEAPAAPPEQQATLESITTPSQPAAPAQKPRTPRHRF